MQYLLNAADPAAMSAQLSGLGWLGKGEAILAAGKAGEGNMNCTLRVQTTQRSFILKQSRAWVEKYPRIPAPEERILVEAAFYQAVRSAAMPRLLGFDAASRLLMLEDVAPAPDFTFLYCGTPADGADLRALVDFLAELHEIRADDAIFENRAMRQLNYEHIFDLPLRAGNGLGYEMLAAPLAGDGAYVARVRQLGELYLGDGPALLHGDFFPGSWLKAASGPKVIDPEFCFQGPPEFDLGVMTAHLLMADTPFEPARAYGRAADAALVRQFAGVEIMRRLVGVAQLPLNRTIEEKAALLRLSRDLVLS